MRYDTQRREFGVADGPPLVPGRLFAVRGWGLVTRVLAEDPTDTHSWRVNAPDTVGGMLAEGRLLPEQVRLCAAAHGALARWDPGPNEAACLFHGSKDGRAVMSCTCGCTDYKFAIANAAHRKYDDQYGGIPGKGLPLECSCGFYGYFSEELETADNLIGSVFGIVEAWGHVIVGSKGLRAQFARVACLVAKPAVTATQLRRRNRFINATPLNSAGQATGPTVTTPVSMSRWELEEWPVSDEYRTLVSALARVYDVPVYPDIKVAVAHMPPTPPDLDALREGERPAKTTTELLTEPWVGTGVAAGAASTEARRRALEQWKQTSRRMERGRPAPGGGIVYRWQQDDRSPGRYKISEAGDPTEVVEVGGRVVATPPADLFPDLPEDPGIKGPEAEAGPEVTED